MEGKEGCPRGVQCPARVTSSAGVNRSRSISEKIQRRVVASSSSFPRWRRGSGRAMMGPGVNEDAQRRLGVLTHLIAGHPSKPQTEGVHQLRGNSLPYVSLRTRRLCNGFLIATRCGRGLIRRGTKSERERRRRSQLEERNWKLMGGSALCS